MTSDNCYTRLWQSLTPLYERDEAIAIARLVLETLFDLSLTDIVCGRADELSAIDQTRLQQVGDRLLRGEPVQYVLGQTTFFGRPFAVSPAVLIPRPETEELCRMIVDNEAQRPSPDVLDIGTGSGCIAITLALELQQSRVAAWDVSDDALAVAQANAHSLQAAVSFHHRDALNLMPEQSAMWDIIVSNPPYVIESEQASMHENVLRHEPATALFVPDSDPLRFYRAIARYGTTALRRGGRLYFEINPLFADELVAMLAGLGYADVRIADDQFRHRRFALAQWMGNHKDNR